MKNVRIWSSFDPYFPAFILNSKRYGPEKLRIRFTQWEFTKNNRSYFNYEILFKGYLKSATIVSSESLWVHKNSIPIVPIPIIPIPIPNEL